MSRGEAGHVRFVVEHSREEGRGTDPFGSRNQKGPGYPGVHGVHHSASTIGRACRLTGLAVPPDRKGVELGEELLPKPHDFAGGARYWPHHAKPRR